MNHKRFSGLFLFIVLSGWFSLSGQTVSIIKFDQLKAMMDQQNDTTYVFNFWATWCGPCIKELPDFQKFSESQAGKKFRLIFISLDFKSSFETALVPFVKKRSIKNEVYLLNEPDYNSWIDKVEPSWGGEIPMTLVINNTTDNSRPGSETKLYKCYPHEFTYEELEKTLMPFIR